MLPNRVAEKPPPLVQVSLPKLEGLAGIKMGPGVMVRSATICIALAALGSAAAIPLAFVNSWASLLVIALVVGAILFIVQKAFSHIAKHPDQALLEDANLLKKHQLDLRAQNRNVIEGSAKAVANTAPPLAITSKGNGGD